MVTNSTPLVFCHFGNPRYLKYTLRCAKRTNPSRKLVLLGDQSNRKTALREGWEHYPFERFKSPLHSDFERVYRQVQGLDHNPMRGKRDWLKFVFERWYHVEGFAREFDADRFWHFDSDTMILGDLSEYEETLQDFDFTLQCNNTCLNGLVKRDVLSDFNKHTVSLFENDDFLSSQQHEFDTIHPNYAFTEMRAFADFRKGTSFRGLHLMQFPDDIAFDDAVRQSQGFETSQFGRSKEIKGIYGRDGSVFGKRDDVEIKFATLNLSWMSLSAYNWVLRALDGNDGSLAEYIKSWWPRQF